MTILTVNRKQFEKDIGKLDEKMQEKIAMFGTPVEDLNDEELQIEIFPNRPDLLAYQNYKDSFLSFLGKKSGLRKINMNKPEKNYVVKVDSSVKDVRPYTTCAIVRNLKLNDERIKEIIDVQEKLHITLGRKRKKAAIGIYPLEKIKLPIKYEARDPRKINFVPLESDKEMNGLQILQRHPTGRDYAYLLEGCKQFPIFVDANDKILSMPPIINSHETGKVSKETKDVFIECSGFDLKTLEKILNIICYALEGIGGKVYQMKVQYSKTMTTPDFSPEKMKVSVENINKLLGLNLKEAEIKKLLGKMGYDYSKGSVLVPAYRTDVLHEVDIIEDVAIAYGYDNFVPEIPEVSTIGEVNPKHILKDRISDILSGLQLLETSSYHLTTKEYQVKKMGGKNDVASVKDSKTDYNLLRKDLTHYLLRIFYENSDVEYPQEIFQIGKVFENYKEKENLAIGLAPGNFTKLKQILAYLGKMLDVKFAISNPKEFPSHYIDGRVAEVSFDGKIIGYFGEISPRILKNFKVKMPVSLLEINIDDILDKLTTQNNS